ncbi:MAG: P1 family peptidase [Shimia sp.]
MSFPPGPRNLITDVGGLRVGNAHDENVRSGVTVLTADAPFTAGVHVMGGAPGTRETDLLAPDKLVQGVDALVLSGGSAFGLAAADGVALALRDEGRGFAVGPYRVPIVPAAILFDLMNGGAHDWRVSPYPALGRAAYGAASAEFSLGTYGAGAGATTATLAGGLGSASCRVGGYTVGALVAANPVGTVCDGEGRFFASTLEEGDEFGTRGPAQPTKLTVKGADPGGATTIGILATDAALDKAGCQRLAIAAHDGFARAIQPSHTPFDGDLIFSAATGAGDPPDSAMLLTLCHAAATCTARAVARGVYHASGWPGGTPSWQAAFGDGQAPR